MIPELNLDDIAIDEVERSLKEENQGKTFMYDFEKGDFVLKDGKLIVAEGKEGVKVWIKKILLTDEFVFSIYKEPNSDIDIENDEYGTTIRKLILGRKIPVLLLQSELKRIIEEKMQQHSDIEKIESFETRHEKSTLIISFTVILKDGDSFDFRHEVE